MNIINIMFDLPELVSKADWANCHSISPLPCIVSLSPIIGLQVIPAWLELRLVNTCWKNPESFYRIRETQTFTFSVTCLPDSVRNSELYTNSNHLRRINTLRAMYDLRIKPPDYRQSLKSYRMLWTWSASLNR